jgi:hypothetical protein
MGKQIITIKKGMTVGIGIFSVTLKNDAKAILEIDDVRPAVRQWQLKRLKRKRGKTYITY